MLTSPHLHEKDREVCIKTRSPPASLLLKGPVTEHTTVKWTIGKMSDQKEDLKGQMTWAELLEAWLALTQVKYHDNL